MNLEKLKDKMEAAKVVEELLILSEKVFGNNTDEAKKVIEMFITKSYLMGKQNTVKICDD